MSNEDTPQLKIPRSADPVPTAPKLKQKRIPLGLYLGGALTLIVGLIFSASSIGWFQTSGRVDGSGGKIELTATSTGADLKGWMTIQDLLDAFSIPKEEFVATFNLPSDIDTTEKLGPLGESVEGFELEAVRTWLDARVQVANGEVPESADPAASHEPQSGALGDGTGEWADAAVQVRGRTTLDELVAATGSSRAELFEVFAIPTSVPGSTRLVDLESVGVTGVEVLDVRIWANP